MYVKPCACVRVCVYPVPGRVGVGVSGLTDVGAGGGRGQAFIYHWKGLGSCAYIPLRYRPLHAPAARPDLAAAPMPAPRLCRVEWRGRGGEGGAAGVGKVRGDGVVVFSACLDEAGVAGWWAW